MRISRLNVIAAAGVAAVGVAVGLAQVAAGAATAATAAWHRATEIRLPPKAPAGFQDAGLTAVSCPRAGSCEGGGFYESGLGITSPMVVAAAKGRWKQAQRLRLPAGTAAIQLAVISSVACTAPGSCVAVGGYKAGHAGQGQAFVAVQAKGRWARASRVRLPSNAAGTPVPQLNAVACTGPGSCVAGGGYTDKAGTQQLMIVTESRGRWERARELASPGNAGHNPVSAIAGLSCPRAGYCSAVGSYSESSGYRRGLAAAESRGSWHRATTIALPLNAAADPGAGLDGVACTGVGSCVAAGGYATSTGSFQAMVVTESRGRWHRAAQITPPGNAAANPDAELVGAGCTGTGSCVAAGSYLSSSEHAQAMVATESGGRWHRAAEVSGPANAATGTDQDAQFFAAACAHGGNCAAVGYYEDDAGHYQAMAAADGR